MHESDGMRVTAFGSVAVRPRACECEPSLCVRKCPMCLGELAKGMRTPHVTVLLWLVRCVECRASLIMLGARWLY